MIADNSPVLSHSSGTIVTKGLASADWIDRMARLHTVVGSRSEIARSDALQAGPEDWIDRMMASHSLDFALSRQGPRSISSR
jgi:hypothetical protein